MSEEKPWLALINERQFYNCRSEEPLKHEWDRRQAVAVMDSIRETISKGWREYGCAPATITLTREDYDKLKNLPLAIPHYDDPGLPQFNPYGMMVFGVRVYPEDSPLIASD